MKNERGFTLIELLIVIAIIGILGAALLTMINPAQQQRKARVARMRSDITKISEAAESYAAEFGTYASLNANGAPVANDGDTGQACWTNWSGEGYARGDLPTDPEGENYTISCTNEQVTVEGTVNTGTDEELTLTYDSAEGRAVEGPTCLAAGTPCGTWVQCRDNCCSGYRWDSPSRRYVCR